MSISNGRFHKRLCGWLLAFVGAAVYLLTMEPTVSFWDCGEFIASSYFLQVGHPSGAPLYWLIAHCFSWLAGGNVHAVAVFCNALSALAGGLTVMFLYWTICDLLPKRDGWLFRCLPAVGALCYLFCDTVWFSAVESEVYALAVLFAAVAFWSMVQWWHSASQRCDKWLLLTALLLGLGTCVHLLVLLVVPALLLIIIFKGTQNKSANGTLGKNIVRRIPLAALFFVLGLTPYLIIPLRAAGNPPINVGNPSNAERFKAYLSREQYEHAPLYPRMWRHHENDALYSADWSGGDNGFVGNMQYFATYQLGYMYLRYLMWNFSGRFNDAQGFGNLQNGQLLTGIPFIDKMIVGTGAKPPQSLSHGRHVYFLLPLLLGLFGLCMQSDKKSFWVVMTLFLVTGLGLSIFLNHPTYEPRERDYAYVLSFYAFAIWIGVGAVELAARIKQLRWQKISLLLFAIPALMAFQNWDDHDRSNRFIARDASCNLLESCEKGAILFTWGDNDTFPVWYVQQVEQVRTDVEVHNVNLYGYRQSMELLNDNLGKRPIYLSYYAQEEFRPFVNCVATGNAYRIDAQLDDSVDVEMMYDNVMHKMQWREVDKAYVDEVSSRFLDRYWQGVVLLANRLAASGELKKAEQVLNKTLQEIPLKVIRNPQTLFDVQQTFSLLDMPKASSLTTEVRSRLEEELAYYHRLPLRKQRLLPFTIPPRELIYELITVNSDLNLNLDFKQL
ncbi:MAG: DUF2723 domain-containing protein [Bacteroidales bacterium]|nr:DUF2723 domain-containing protein [Bacteroidales bacterium]